jgi:hypothetical protein
MSGRIVISYGTQDSDLGSRIVHFFQAMLSAVEVSGSSLPGHVPGGGDDSLAALKQRLASAEVVVGLITPRALASGEVPFQLGAAWSLGTRLVLLLEPGDTHAELYLPMGHAEMLVLGPEALIELAVSLAGPAGAAGMPGNDLTAAAREALALLFPDFPGLDRASSERPINRPSSVTTQQMWPLKENGEPGGPPPAPARSTPPPAHRTLPSCNASLQAGRAIADCVFHRDQGGRFGDELDQPFGAFLSGLGADWSTLRKLDDLDVWLEAAENVLATLPADGQRIAAYYEVGYQLSTLINLAHRVGEGAGPANHEVAAQWRGAYAALREAAHALPEAGAVVGDLEPMLENLYGPMPPRDTANLGRIQQRIRDLADRADAAVLAASA